MSSVRVTCVGVGSTGWVVIDPNAETDISVQLEPNGGTVTVEATLDPNLKTSRDEVPADQVVSITDLVDKTANGIFTVKGPIKGIRLTQTVGGSTSALTVMVKINRS